MKLRISALCTTIIFSLYTNISSASNRPVRDLDLEDEPSRRELVHSLYTDPEMVQAVQQITKDVTELLEKHGIPFFAVYGTMLGATRQKKEGVVGGMVRWDDDADLGTFSKYMGTLRDRPFRGALRELGYSIVKHPSVGLQIQELTQRVHPKTKEPYTLSLDIFLYQPSEDGLRYEAYPNEIKTLWPRGWFKKEELDNLVRIPFGTLTLWAPSNAEDYLTRLYGKEWKTRAHYYFSHHSNIGTKMECTLKWTLVGPDLEPAPGTGPLANRVQGMPKPRKPSIPVVNRRESLSNFNGAFWNRFYSAGGLAREPSSFCQYILDKGMLSEGTTLLDVGCGNGRDTFEFRKKGIHAYGLDSSQEATASNLLCARKEGMPGEFFRTVDVCSADAMAEFQNFEAVYARFFIHAINEAQEAGFMTFLSRLSPGTHLFLEFRTERDPMLEMSTKVAPNKGKTDHYRRFINFGAFEKKIFDLGFKINESIEADNLSVATKVDPVKGQIVDNPMLGRIIATKR